MYVYTPTYIRMFYFYGFIDTCFSPSHYPISLTTIFPRVISTVWPFRNNHTSNILQFKCIMHQRYRQWQKVQHPIIKVYLTAFIESSFIQEQRHVEQWIFTSHYATLHSIVHQRQCMHIHVYLYIYLTSMLHEHFFISEKAHVPFGTGLFSVSIMVNGLGPFCCRWQNFSLSNG